MKAQKNTIKRRFFHGKSSGNQFSEKEKSIDNKLADKQIEQNQSAENSKNQTTRPQGRK
ncbi:hypothetical protein [Phocaeicola faecicola]|uniref:hypothetical protein n=1 Tax=Phocaeicola faecicola TaxID=2739389 RepID=UPI002A7EF081|nr:hypothetical protein [Phocaeicola faecicola]MDD6908184.1 hypothetical protein [Bacteroidaceae bacterium]MDY4872972.1 hypothetical protein [Phocaeicola faecicola]